jgi:adenosylhomocysteine nucleosidase
MNRENGSLCLVFPMGMELHPFLHRVEVTGRWTVGRATYRAASFEGCQLVTVRCGVGPVRAAAAVRQLAEKPEAILSVGTAGALVEDLRVGDLVVASKTFLHDAPHESIMCAPDLVETLAEACRQEGRRFTVGGLVTVRDAVFAREHRNRLFRATGALAVDMESHAIGRQAKELGIPFACLRVISDDVHASGLPPKPRFERAWTGPWLLPSMISTTLKRRRFLKKFRKAIEELPPILVRLLRGSEKARAQDSR